MVFLLIAFQAMSGVRVLAPEHAIHISKCIVEVKPGAIQLRFHIWLDDLHKALNYNSQQTVSGSSKKHELPAKDLVSNYIKAHFSLKINGHSTQLNLTENSYSEDQLAIWATGKVDFNGDINSISVLNNILMEIYDDQKNIVQIKLSDGAQGYFIFESPSQEERLNL